MGEDGDGQVKVLVGSPEITLYLKPFGDGAPVFAARVLNVSEGAVDLIASES